MTAALTIRDLRTRAVRVPMRRPLGTSRGVVREAPLVLVDLDTDQGVTGHAYIWAYTDNGARALRVLVAEVLSMVRGDQVAPAALHKKVSARFTLIGREGLPQMALSALDVAAWDALARAAGLPLVRMLGGEVRPVPAYNSNGLGLLGADAAAAEAQEIVGEGFRAVKLRLGYPTLAEDLAAVRAVMRAVPAGTRLLTDYNQALSVAEAVHRGRALDEEGIAWIEEPIRHDDYLGSARVAQELATPVQIGENFIGTHQMAAAIEAEASDFVMPDLARIGGVTGWLRAAGIAEAAGLEMSSHLFPETSAHLLAVTPTAHFLEYVDWAAPILKEPLRVEEGHARIPDRPGTGVEWDEDAVRRYALE